MSIRVLLADDHKIVLEGLRSLLQDEAGIEVIAEAQDGRAAMKLAHELKPDVVVMDVAMPDLNGIESTRKITADLPEVKVLALSMHSDKAFVSEMSRAGASGYLLKDCAFDELARAIRAVAAGNKWFSPKIEAMLKDGEGGLPVTSVLTPREREVLQLFAEAKNTKEIALRLNISVKTVEAHRQNIIRKLRIRNLAELTRYAIREGLTFL